MGIFLITLAIIFLIGMIIFGYTWNDYNHRPIKERLNKTLGYTMIWAALFAFVYGIVAIVSLIGSYDSYLDARAYYDNLIAQYKGAIVLYEDKAVSLDMEKAAKYALTDLRFQGYQEKMGTFVMDLREKVTIYNRCIIKKRLMKKNFFYNWYIIPPDADMKTIDIIGRE